MNIVESSYTLAGGQNPSEKMQKVFKNVARILIPIMLIVAIFWWMLILANLFVLMPHTIMKSLQSTSSSVELWVTTSTQIIAFFGVVVIFRTILRAILLLYNIRASINLFVWVTCAFFVTVGMLSSVVVWIGIPVVIVAMSLFFDRPEFDGIASRIVDKVFGWKSRSEVQPVS